METTVSASDTIRIRVEPEMKSEVLAHFARKGTTVSQAVRGFLSEELQIPQSRADRLDALAASAEQKLSASGLAEPTMSEILDYVEEVRQERKADMAKAS
ncbi:MAG: hypothetical protein LBL23_01540 [Coriobacteriales bacterium]|jgi:antitoxin component of RelBE/YafQ-DinJ toxin-antitoxin module|nr:hypothetical protein [Coriobacteriales bacterium]